MRVLKPHGVFYLNAPSTVGYHQFPVDCWRFYPDSGKALVNYSKRRGFNPELLVSYIFVGGSFQDFVGVFVKDKNYSKIHENKTINSEKVNYENAYSAWNQK
jgi:hypothetical protein